MMMMSDPERIVLNMAKCRQCRRVLISATRHDYRVCDCPNRTAVDGGTSYLRRAGVNLTLIEELSIVAVGDPPVFYSDGDVSEWVES